MAKNINKTPITIKAILIMLVMVEVFEFETLDTLLTEDEVLEVDVLLVTKLLDVGLALGFATLLVVGFVVVGPVDAGLVAVLVVAGSVAVEFSVKFKSIP